MNGSHICIAIATPQETPAIPSSKGSARISLGATFLSHVMDGGGGGNHMRKRNSGRGRVGSSRWENSWRWWGGGNEPQLHFIYF